MNKEKDKSHLSIEDRVEIATGLNPKRTATEIAARIGCANTTVSREVKGHYSVERNGAYGRSFNDCANRTDCKVAHECSRWSSGAFVDDGQRLHPQGSGRVLATTKISIGPFQLALTGLQQENIKPDKEKSTEKIDGAVALIMALNRAIRNGSATGESIYDTRGILLI